MSLDLPASISLFSYLLGVTINVISYYTSNFQSNLLLLFVIEGDYVSYYELYAPVSLSLYTSCFLLCLTAGQHHKAERLSFETPERLYQSIQVSNNNTVN